MNLMGEIRRQIKVVEELPPQPHVIYARYDVTGVRHMWDTKGRKIVYVDRRAIDALPKTEIGQFVVRSVPWQVGPIGIPVIFEGPSLMEEIERRWPTTRWIR